VVRDRLLDLIRGRDTVINQAVAVIAADVSNAGGRNRTQFPASGSKQNS